MTADLCPPVGVQHARLPSLHELDLARSLRNVPFVAACDTMERVTNLLGRCGRVQRVSAARHPSSTRPSASARPLRRAWLPWRLPRERGCDRGRLRGLGHRHRFHFTAYHSTSTKPIITTKASLVLIAVRITGLLLRLLAASRSGCVNAQGVVERSASVVHPLASYYRRRGSRGHDRDRATSHRPRRPRP